MATRESSLTIAACFRRIPLPPLTLSLSSSIPRYSLTIPSLSLARACSFSLALAASVALPRPPPPPTPSPIPISFHSPGTSYVSLPPSCPLSPVALSPNLHSIPLLSSLHSTPKYCNFSLVATTALQLRNDKFLARLPCLVPPRYLSSSAPRSSSYRRQPLRVSSAVKLVRSIDSID